MEESDFSVHALRSQTHGHLFYRAVERSAQAEVTGVPNILLCLTPTANPLSLPSKYIQNPTPFYQLH